MNRILSQESEKNEALMQVYDQIKHTELSEEFILPDYLPDVKRIVRIDARPRLDAKFITRDRLDYEGDVLCHILFCDEASHLKSVTFTLSFADGADIEGISDECVANLIPMPESVSCKLLNPRRLSIRMRIDTALTVWCTKSFTPTMVNEPQGLQLCSKKLEVMKLLCSGESALTVNAELEADGALPQINEIISTNADIAFYECKPSDGKVLCRGDLSLTVFYSSLGGGEETYNVLFRKIPLAQVVLCDGVNDTYNCMARGFADNVNMTVSENGFGERRLIDALVNYRVYLNCVGSDEISVCKDAYGVSSTVNTETENETFYRFSKLYSTTFGATLSTERSELKLQDASSVFALSATPKVSEVVLSDDRSRLTVTGAAACSAVIKGESGLTVHDYMLPFKVELEASGVCEPFIYNCDIVCMGAKGRFDLENLYTELDLQLNLMLLRTETVEVLKKAEFSEPSTAPENPEMRFYYPSEGETLWDIGKSFGIPISALTESNDIVNDTLPSILFIPTKI